MKTSKLPSSNDEWIQSFGRKSKELGWIISITENFEDMIPSNPSLNFGSQLWTLCKINYMQKS